MAQYDYVCEDGHLYMEIRSMSEEQKVTACPEDGCGKTLSRVWYGVPTVFSGKGFYSTDKNSYLLKPGQPYDA